MIENPETNHSLQGLPVCPQKNPKAQNSPKARQNVVLGPKKTFKYEPLEPYGKAVRSVGSKAGAFFGAAAGAGILPCIPHSKQFPISP